MKERAELIEEGRASTKIPRPVDGGSVHIESLGRLVDNLLGDARVRKAANEHLKVFMMGQENEPADPPPSDAPTPVPGGTSTSSRGGRIGDAK